ncbi:TIGR00730 family Rossman fold protein [Smaragdicoccus niigatensis]|nr:TIGR00730 family Rossman fold protein [Smaragdicoccus niigatensis]
MTSDPRERSLRSDQSPLSVCVYCSSGTTDPDSLAVARRIGAGIGRRGWQLVSGGGNVSMMGMLVHAAREAGGRTVGVIPHSLVHRELADTESDELIVTETMRERKQIMEDRADAFVILPGGLGTLEEMFEIWTGALLQMHDKPVVLLDPHGHYDGLLDWLKTLSATRFVSDYALDLLTVTRTVDDALAACVK